METKLSATEPGGRGGADLTPLDFLSGVMADPEVTSGQRIKAARVAARYKHSQAHPDELPIVIEDKFGFKIDPLVARAMRDALLRKEHLWCLGVTRPEGSDKEMDRLGNRVSDLGKTVECPVDYTRLDVEEDEKRLREFYIMRNSFRKLTPEEDAEEAHLVARIEAHRCSPHPDPVSRLWSLELDMEKRALSAEEQSERAQLRARYPDQPDPYDTGLLYFVKVLRQKQAEGLDINSANEIALKAYTKKAESERS